jgi:hypothetical protein
VSRRVMFRAGWMVATIALYVWAAVTERGAS